jgi:hypothetical protein
VDLNLSRTKIEASKNDYSVLTAELKDRYWNLVFNDRSTLVTLDIDDKYKDTIFTWDFKTNWLVDWKTTFKIYWQENPW